MLRLTVVLHLVCICAFAQAQPKLEKIWETDTVTHLKPESVLFHANTNQLFVSNMDIGTIDIVALDGKLIKNDWISGLFTNKGMAIYRDQLFVAEKSTIAVIDIASATILKRIPVQGAVMLNDLAIDRRGTIYVSDTRAGKVYRCTNEQPEIWIDSIAGANGLLVRKNKLYVLSSTKVLEVKPNKSITTVAENFEPGLDGIVYVKNKSWLVSNYKGILYHVDRKGKKQVLLDTRSQNKMMNDISFNESSKTLYVPSYNSSTLLAFSFRN